MPGSCTALSVSLAGREGELVSALESAGVPLPYCSASAGGAVNEE